MRSLRHLPTLILLAAGAAPPVAYAQSPPDTVRVRLTDYSAGPVHRFVLGDLNRRLWSVPVEAAPLDLDTFAGGLTPIRRGGGLQTRSLRLQSADGPVYTFRSIEKDATQGLDPQLRNTLAATVLQDQIGALFPLSAMVVAPLLDAAGVLHADPRLVVMPDSPRLGEFQRDFAGMVGWIEVRPDEGQDGEPAFAGAERVVSTPTFLERLEEEPEQRVDASAFLRARLLDLFVGDWDRHPDQWRWAAFAESGGVTRWYPIPRDRDWALNAIDGVVWSLVRRVIPQYVGFGPEYTSVFGTVWNGRALDRRLLSGLSWAAWEAEVADLQATLADPVLDAAVARLPPAFEAAAGDALRQALRSRRDALPDAARAYYAILAGWVDVFLTDEPERIEVARLADGSVRARARRREGSDATWHFERTFRPTETREIRLYLQGDDDLVEVDGAPDGPIAIRVIGGGGDDAFRDETSGSGVAFYDHRGDNRFERAERTHVQEADYDEPDDTESATHQARARDWGQRTLLYPRLGANRDVGAYLGQTLLWSRYGFRRFPWAHRLELQTVLNPVNFGFQAGATWRMNLSTHGTREWVTTVDAASREIRYWHGTGNASLLTGDAEFHRADRRTAAVFTGLRWRRRERASVEVGIGARHSSPIRSDEPRLVQRDEPYGFGTTAQVGLRARIEVDGRDHPLAPRHGYTVRIAGEATPAALDVTDGYVRVAGEVTGTAAAGPLVGTAYLQLATLSGPAPWFDRPTLGGQRSLRGFRQDRFLGDDTQLVGLELRTPLVPIFLLFPGTLGVSAFAETGRVEGGARWHASYGGGLWASLVSPDYTLSTTLARSRESTRYYVGLGFQR